jgi:hypothetical protein
MSHAEDACEPWIQPRHGKPHAQNQEQIVASGLQADGIEGRTSTPPQKSSILKNLLLKTPHFQERYSSYESKYEDLDSLAPSLRKTNTPRSSAASPLHANKDISASPTSTKLQSASPNHMTSSNQNQPVREVIASPLLKHGNYDKHSPSPVTGRRIYSPSATSMHIRGLKKTSPVEISASREDDEAFDDHSGNQADVWGEALDGRGHSAAYSQSPKNGAVRTHEHRAREDSQNLSGPRTPTLSEARKTIMQRSRASSRPASAPPAAASLQTYLTTTRPSPLKVTLMSPSPPHTKGMSESPTHTGLLIPVTSQQQVPVVASNSRLRSSGATLRSRTTSPASPT